MSRTHELSRALKVYTPDIVAAPGGEFSRCGTRSNSR
jgi:hypothetical protein